MVVTMSVQPSPRTQGKLGYQPSIDGLRAVSVLAVILYHAELSWIPGGFLGVEVFFVVSGFLITALLVEERFHTGSVSLRGFWTRRARRLLPALYVLLLVVPATMLVFYRDAAGRLGGDVLAALFYVSNWWQVLLQESYFAQAGRPPVLRHLWSLAVEEQFYILFPAAFVWLLSRHGRDRTRNVLVVVAIASAIWMAVLYEPYVDPSRVYFGTDTRLSGLLLGAALAVVWTPWRTRADASRAAGPVLDVIGVGALAWLMWFFWRVNEFDPFVYRGGFLLLDLCCLVLIAVLVHPSSRLNRLLALPPLVWLGVRSYSIYLWHWPIFMVTRPELDLPFGGFPVLVIRIGLTLVAAELSYRFVEQPVRNGDIGRFVRRLKESTGAEHARLQQRAFLQVGGMAAVVLLITAGLVEAANSDKRADLEAEVAGAEVLGSTEERDTDTAGSSEDPPSPSTSVVSATAPDGSPAVPALGDTTTTAPTSTVATNAVAVGDSVMLGASGAMKAKMPGLRVDAKVSRQFDTIVDAALWYESSGNLPGPLIVQFGNNGIFEEERLDQMLEEMGDRRVLLVNTKVPRPWEELANERTAAVAKRHDNAVLVDWYALAVDHPGWFVSDGTHLRPAGQQAFAELISSKLNG
jgi:peptidoglycan/LPS O-acetylase OafA/YrhL